MNNTVIPFCPKCGTAISQDTIYCPHCGTRVQEEEIGIGKQIYEYLVSFFLPPLGLVWVFKYLKSTQSKTRTIGWVNLVLTLISVIVMLWLTISFFHGLSQQINSVSSFGQ